MKKALLILMFLVPLTVWGAARTWLSAIVTNPASGQVLLDTGALGGPANYDFCLYFSADVPAAFRVQQRNAANSATVKEQLVTTTAFGSAMMCPLGITLGDQERLRVTNNSVLVGNVSVSILR
jgi:hypothetical protein